jgi:hypothetical protein
MAFTGTASGLSTLPNDMWRDDAACASPDVDREIFFAVGNSGPAHHATMNAKLVCSICPVKAACLKFVTDYPQEFGVFAGLTADERRGRSGASRSGGQRWCYRCSEKYDYDPMRAYARICVPCAAIEEAKAERRKGGRRFAGRREAVSV